MRFRNPVLALGLVLLSGPVLSSEPRMLEGSYLGKRLPEIVVGDGTWLNTKGKVTFESLRGRPVLVTFTVLW